MSSITEISIQEKLFKNKHKSLALSKKLSTVTTLTTISLMTFDIYCELFSNMTKDQLNNQDWIVISNIALFLASRYNLKRAQRNIEKLSALRDFSNLTEKITSYSKDTKLKN